MRRLFSLILYLGSFVCFLLAASTSAFAQCNLDNLNSSYCVDDPSFTLTGGTYYYINNTSTSIFNPATLGAGTHRVVTTNGEANAYNVSTSGTFSPAAPVSPTTVGLGNDQETVPINIGFTFNFFGANYTQLRIGSNGVVGLGAGPSVAGVNEPLGDGTDPDNLIAVAWEDLRPDLSGAEIYRYFLTGTAPFRRFVVDFVNIPQAGTGGNITAQLQIYETTNIIEIHSTSVNFADRFATQGIESPGVPTFTLFYHVNGRNNDTYWSANNNYVAFIPQCLDIKNVTINPLPTVGLTVSPAATTICSGNQVAVTIGSSQSGVLYQLQDNADSSPLSGFYSGTGGNLVITSDALTANKTIKVYARNATTLCDVDLTNKVTVTVNAQPATAAAGADQFRCLNSNFTLAGSDPAPGTGAWTFVGAANGATISSPNASNSLVSGQTQGTSITLRWTVSNTGCTTTFDDVTLTYGAPPPAAIAGPDITQCNNPIFTMAATKPPSVNGTWTFVSPVGGGGAVITDNTSPTTTITNVSPGSTVVLRWTLTTGCAPPTFDDITIKNDAPPTTSNAGADQLNLCNVTSTLLAGNPAVTGTGTWTVVSGTGGSFVAANNPTTTFNGNAGETYVLRWTIANGVCASSTDDVTIRFDQTPSAAVAGTDIEQCANGTFTLNATSPVIGTGVWSVVSGTATITNVNSFNTSVTGVPAGTSATLRWTVSNGSCASNTDDVVLTNRNNPTPTLSSSDGDNTICSGQSVVFTAGGGTNYEFFVSGVSVQNGVGTTYTTSALLNGQVITVRVTNAFGCSVLSSGITMTVNPTPVASIVSNDADNTICAGGSITFTATPSGASQYDFRVDGVSMQTTASNVFTTTTLSDDDVVDVVITSAAGCVGTSTGLTINVDPAPTVSNAGGDQLNLCNVTSTMLAGNPAVTGTGTWTVVSGTGGSFVAANNPTTTFNGNAGETYVLRWTIANGVCASSTDDVTIRFDQTPSAAVAGSDIEQCANGTFTLNATGPVIGTGVWSVVSGTATITNVNSFNTSVTGVPAGTSATLRWTVSNGSCASNTDDVVLTNRNNPTPTLSSSDGDNTICSGQSVVFTAGGGTNYEFFVSGVSVQNGVGTTYTTSALLNGQVITVRVTNAFGCSVLSSGITMTVNPTPVASIVSNDADNTICAGGSITFTATPSGASQYDFRVDGVSMQTTASNVFTTTTLSDDDVVDVVITSAAGCVGTSTGLTINVDPAPTVSNAGGDQLNLCNVTSTMLAGNPAVTGTGTWTVVSGTGGSFVAANNPTTTFNGNAGETYVLRWTIANGVCASSTDDVTIRFDQTPSAAVAGTDIEQCANGTFTLNATSPVIGTGVWSVVSGTATITNVNSFNTSVTGVPAGTSATLRWTVSNGSCASNTDDVVLTNRNNPTPTLSSSDGDNTICSGQSVVFTAGGGTNYEFFVSGVSVQNGAGTTYTTSALLNGQVITVRVTNAFGCSVLSSGITMTVNPTPVASIVSNDADNTICAGGSITFTATPSGASQYDFRVDGVSMQTTASNVFTTTTLSDDDVVDVVITSAAGCVGTSTGLTINVDPAPTVSNAGGDQLNLCNVTSTMLAGNPAVTGTGTWTVVSGTGGSFVAANNPTTTFNGNAGETYVLRWTIANGVCASSTDDVTIRFDQTPSAAVAGTDIEQCANGTFTLNATSPVIGTGVWSVVSGTATITNVNSFNTSVTGVPAGTSATLRWTVSNGSCASNTDDVVLTNRNNPTPTLSSSDGDNTICSGQSVVFTAGGGTNYEFFVSGVSVQNGVGTTYTTSALLNGQVITVRVTNAFGCSVLSSGITMTVNPTPVASIVSNDADNTICAGGSITFTATPSGASQYDFRVDGVSMQTTASNVFTTTTLSDDDVVDVVITSAAGCVGTSTGLTINVDPAPTVSNAGGDQLNLCNVTSTMLAGNPAVTGTGTWTVVSGTGGSFVAANNPTTTFNGNAGETYVLRWTIANGVCASSTDDVTIRFDQTPSAAVAGTDIEQCANGTFTLNATGPVIGTGVWSVVSGTATITNVNSFNTSVTGVPAGTSATLRWTVSNGSCASNTDDVVLTNRNNPTPTLSSSDGDNTICSGQSVVFTAGGGTNYEFFVSGVSVQNGVGTTYTTSALLNGQVITVRVTNAFGCSVLSSGITMTVNPTPVASIVSNDADNTICAGGSITFTATPSGASQYDFRVDGVSMQTTASNVFTTTTLSDDDVVDVVITSAAGCVGTSTGLTINVDTAPNTADAGADIIQCSNGTFTMAANSAVAGTTGTWSIVSGSATITSVNSPVSTITGVAAGSEVVLRWRISNGVCAPSDNEVLIRNEALPTASNAGGDQDICGTNTSLNGNIPVVGTGQWSFAPGGNPDSNGIIADANSRSTVFTGTAGQTYTLRWTITNGSCAPSTDDVQIRFEETPILANAGPDQNLCGVTFATLAGNAPVTGSGAWTVISGAGGSFVDATSPTTTFNGSAGTAYILRWTLNNGVCSDSFDEVAIRFDQSPAIAAAGPDQNLCATTAILAANDPSPGTGLWTVQSGAGGSFVDATDANTTFNGAPNTTYVLRWTINSQLGVCAATFDEVQIRFDQIPTVASAGPDKNSCGTSAVLDGNAALVGSGQWTIISGAGGSFVDNTDENTTFNGIAGNVYVLRWTITGVCATTFDEVQITLNDTPTVASAGPDDNVCATSFVLAGNTPTVGTGLWTVVSGAGGSFVDNTDPNTIFNGASGTTYVLRWTISNGACPVSFDEVQIRLDQTPTPATAGVDQNICGSSVTLAGNAPLVGTGSWTITSGAGGSFTDNTNPTTVFNGVDGTTYVLRWTITNGLCSTFDEVTVTHFVTPTIAAAGSDDEQCGNGTFNLNANSPVIGTGLWSIVGAANGATVNTPSSPTSTVTGLNAGTSVTLRWTITNGSCSSVDELVLTHSAIPPVAAAGTDQTLCNTAIFTLAGNAAGPGAGTWTIQGAANGASITNINSPTTTVTGLTAGFSVTLRWTIANGSCSTFDDVVLTSDATPVAVSAGGDQSLCGTSNFTLTANAPSPLTASGLWTIIGAANGAVITDNTSPVSTVTGLNPNTSVTLRWTVTNGTCSNFDDVVLTNNATPPVAVAGPDQTFCNASIFTLAGNAATPGTGTWTIIGAANGASITNVNLGNTTVTGLTPGSTVTLRWTITNGSCASSFDDVVLTNNDAPVATLSSSDADNTICAGASVVFTAGGVGTNFEFFVNGSSVQNGAVTTFTTTTLANGNVVTVRVTNAAGCSTVSAGIATTVHPVPMVNIVSNDADNSICSGSPVIFTATPSGIATYRFRVNGAVVQTGGSNTFSTLTLADNDNVDVEVTTASGCVVASTATITMNVDTPLNTSNAGGDIVQCDNTTFTMAGNAVLGGATGTWSIVSGSATITSPNSPTTTITGVASGSDVILRWSITNGECATSTDDILIRNLALPTVSAAGTDQSICGISTNLNANAAATGIGQWSFAPGGSGDGLGVIGDANNRSSVFSGTAGQTYTLRWTISNGSCTSSTDDVTITFGGSIPIANAGADQLNLCGVTSATLAGNSASPGTGTWTVISGSGGSFVSVNSATTTFNGNADETYVLRWTISNGICANSTDEVTIRFDQTPSAANAGTDITQCSNGTFALNAVDPAVGNGVWTVQAGTATITDANSFSTTATGVPLGQSATLRWTVSNGSCASSFDDVVLTNNDAPVATLSSSDADNTICAGASVVFTAGGVGTNFEFFVNGSSVQNGAVTTFTTTTLANGNVVTVRVTNAAGCSTVSAGIATTVHPVPMVNIVSNDADNSICSGSPVIFTATPSGIATYRFRVNGAVVQTGGSNTFSTLTLADNDNVDVEVTTASGCVVASTATITMNVDTPLNTSNAGGDIVQCDNTTFTMAGNAVLGGATGTWSIVSGSATITSPNSPTTTITGVASGSDVILRWSITNGECATSTDDILIRNLALPTVSAAGSDQSICGISTNLNANAAATGTGQWSFAPGGSGDGLGVIGDANNRSSVFSGTAGQTYTLRWTISNGSCTSSTDDVTITFGGSIPIANAGADQLNLCGVTSATLAGNSASPGTGTWTVISGSGGSFVSVNSATTTFNGNADETYVLRWTISNGICANSTDEVTIRFDQTPSAANAGTDITQCSNGTFALNAVDPAVGNGVWTVQAGTATITDANSFSTTATGVPLGQSATLRWTVSNGSCAVTFADVVLTNIEAPAPADAGTDQELCSTPSFTLVATAPSPATASGLWTIVGPANGAIITDNTSLTSTVTGLTAGSSATLRWTVTNGICTNFDDVVLTNSATPPVAAAGVDQMLCNTPNFTLAANASGLGTGLWTIDAGSATITNTTSATTTVTGVPVGTSVTLRWTISNGSCATSDVMVLTNSASPTTALAGPDQELCSSANFTLAANTPVTGTGLWSIIGSANGAVITTPASESSTVTGLTIGSSVTLRWTITNGSCSSFDELVLTNNSTATVATAGADLEQCNNPTFTLSGNAPGVGSGTWSVQGAANGASITNVNLHNTTVTGLNAGFSVTLRWTITNGSCISFDDVVLTNNTSPTVATAGGDQQVCGPTTPLAANTPGVGTGSWTIVSGAGGVVTTTSDPVSSFSGITGNTYVLRWTVTNGICSSFDDVQVLLKTIPDVAASPQTICSGSSTNIAITNPNAVPGTTFGWVIQSISNITGAAAGSGTQISQMLTVTDAITQGTVTYRITPSANGCSGTPLDVTVTVNPTPVITTPASSLVEVVCSDDQLNFTPSSTVAGTTFSWTATFSGSLTGISASGTGAITDTPVNTGNNSGTVTYVITPEISGCFGASVNYVVTVRPKPNVAASDQGICSGQSTVIGITNPNNVTGTTFNWIIQSNTNVNGAVAGSGSNIGQVLTSADGISTGTVVYRITPSANGCDGAFIDVSVTVTPVPVITNAAADFSVQICSNETLSFLPTSTIAGTTYSWTTTISGPISAASVTASGNGLINDTPQNTGNVQGTVTYRITPAFNGCNGSPVDLVVNVKPLPSASGSDFTICSGQTAFITIDPSPKNVAGTTFTWTALPSANITGATNGNGSTINQLLTTTNAVVGTVTYSITPFANGCAGPVEDIFATVNPIASVSAGADFQVCEPGSIPVSGTIGGSASNGTWSIVSGTGSVSASATAAGTVTATYTVGAGDIGATVLLRLTTNDPDAAGPCSIVSDDLLITVNQAPRVTVPADFVVCEPPSIPLTGDLDPSATAGSWSVISGAGTLSVSSITGDIVTATYTPHASDIGSSVSFRLTTNDPDGFGPCVPAFDDITIAINESAKVDAGPTIETCEDEVIQLNGSYSGMTSSVVWSGGGGASRFSDVSNPLSTYSLTPADISAGSVTLSLTTNDPDGAGPCTIVNDQVTIQINKLPVVGLFGLDGAYAENSEVALLNGFPSPGIFTGPGILAGSNQFNPANAGTGSKLITYTYTDGNGCTNSASQTTIVNPVTEIDFNIEEPSDVDALGRLVICENSGNNNLLRLIGRPEWNDPSANSAQFRSPNATLQARIVFDGVNGYRINTAGLQGGTYLIEYIFTNTALATDTLTKVLIVNSAPKGIIDVRNSCIQDVITYQDNSAIPNNTSSGTIDRWSWTYGEGGNGNDGVSQNPTYQYTSEGFKTLSLRVTTNQGCFHDTTKVIRVSNPPSPDFTWSKICVATETTEFKDLSNPGIGNIIQYSWDFADGDTLGYGVPAKAVPASTHGGKTSNTYKDPYHRYDNFQIYNVKLSIKTDDGCENAITKRIFILDYGKPTATNGYYENFEGGKGTWVETSSHNDLNKAGEYSWVFGTPAGSEINSAYSGVNAWWTGGNPNSATDFSTYYQNDSTEVTGPCLDLTGIERPMMSLNYWSHSQENFDGAVVQYSTNGGATWKTIGDAEKRGINWYNSKNIPGAPGGQDNFAWSGKTYGWKNARFNLDEIPVADRDLVVIRIAFGSNSDNLPDSILNGFAFDDIYIGEKKRTVLVEQFVNSNSNISGQARTYLENLYNNQTISGLKTQSDFIKMQYHIAKGGFDQLNDDNPTDPNSRAFIYNLDTPPVTVMDGILGPSPYNGANNVVSTFNGDHAVINAVEIDRRALDDPKFNIAVTMDMTQSANTPLVGNVSFTYIDSVNNFTTPVILHAALIEGNISGNRNVLRKLLWESGGRTENRTWAEGDNLNVPINYTFDVPVSDPNNLYLITFVQDKLTDYILQASITKVPSKLGLTPVGIEDNPMDAEIRNIHVYPNPASRYVNFALENPLSGDYTYRIIDQRGVTIIEGELNHDLSTPQEVALNSLSNGIYFVQFRTQERVIVYRKIAVMNRH